MTTPAPRALRRAGAGIAAVLAAGALTAVPAPALADSPVPNLLVEFTPTEASVNTGGESYGARLTNSGTAPATGVTVTFDGSGLTDAVVFTLVEGTPGCTQAGAVVTCQNADLAPGQADTTYPIRLASKPDAVAGAAGGLVATLRGTGPEDKVYTDEATLPVNVAPAGPNLAAHADDIGSAVDRVGGGDTRPLYAVVVNEGDSAADGFVASVSLPTGASFAERYSDCVYAGDWTGDPPAGYVYGPNAVSCPIPEVTLGPGELVSLFNPQTRTALFNVTFGNNLRGPDTIESSFTVGLIDDAPLAARSATRAPQGRSFAAEFAKLQAEIAGDKSARLAALKEIDTADNIARFDIWSKANTHDFEVTASAVTGSVGDTVEVPYKITNHGPSDGGASWRIVAPSGTVLLPSAMCTFKDSNGTAVDELTQVQCTDEGEWPAKASGHGSVSAKIKIKIKSTPGTSGTISVNPSAPATDPKSDNNTAKIVINAAGGGGGAADGDDELPITGARTGPTGAIGAGLVLLGAVLLVLSRRRRAGSA